MATVNIYSGGVSANRFKYSASECGTAEYGSDCSGHPYWSAEFHDADNMLREEHWSPPLRQFLLPGASDPSIVQLTSTDASAILRYVEEVKMYANIEAEKRHVIVEEVLDDAFFWDDQDIRIRAEWPTSSIRGPWLEALIRLETALHTVVTAQSTGAFIKLSARSPKDAVMRTSRYKDSVVHGCHILKNSSVPLTLADEIRVLKRASWEAMRVQTGADALALLLRSDRVYKDILCHELFNNRPDSTCKKIQLDVFVHGWFPQLDPEFEFRGFVAGGVRTGLTAYNPWIYNKTIHRQKSTVLQIIQTFWDKVDKKIPATMRDYTIDFAVDPSLNGDVWIIEVNNTLPPMAGSCLFKYANRVDREILKNGPFEFRVLEAPWDPEVDYANARDASSGRSTILLPASPAWLDFARRTSGRKMPEKGHPWDKSVEIGDKSGEMQDDNSNVKSAVSMSTSNPVGDLTTNLVQFWNWLWM